MFNEFGSSAGPRFDSGRDPVNSNQYGFEQIDPHENTGFTLTLGKDSQNSNSEESSENRETFSGSKFTQD